MMRGEQRAPYAQEATSTVPPAFGGNREQRRAAARGKAEPVTVSREVPMSVIASADGTHQVVNHETDEPCFGCPCCALWARSLDMLQTAMREHETETVGGLGDPGCLVCNMLNRRMAGSE